MTATTAKFMPTADARSGMQRLLNPQSIAVVGASTAPGKLGNSMLNAVASSPRDISVYGINPRVQGPQFKPTLAAATKTHGGPIDLAVLCIPAAATPDALEQAAACGIGAALICSGGFAETGAAGEELQARVADIRARTGMRILGPNTSGFFRPGETTVSFVPTVDQLIAGPVGVISASGGMNHALSFMLSEHGVGVAIGVGLGNCVDVTATDVVRSLADDDSVTAVALHIESVSDGEIFLEAVRATTAVKPIVAIVVGRSDVSDFSASHTGALATSWRTTRALLTEAGAVVVDSETELVNALKVLSRTRLPAIEEPGVGIVTGQAGPGLMVLDELQTRRVTIPRLADETAGSLAQLLPPMTFQRNPVDTGRPGDTFAEVLATTASDPGVNALAVYALAEPDAIDIGAAVRDSGILRTQPVVLGTGGPRESLQEAAASAGDDGIPVLDGPTALAVGVDALVRDARLQFLAAERSDPAGTGPSKNSGATPDSEPFDEPFTEATAKDLLNSVGIATPDRRVCANREEAHEALTQLNRPVAVKILNAEVIHKTDIGGVHLGISNETALDAALDALDAVGAREYLLEEMATEGVDLFVGVRRDRVFGPVLVAGFGGTAAEVLGDVAIRSAAITERGAEAMLDDLVCAPLLDGWRGGPILDRGSFGRIAKALTALVVAHSEILDLEINPLRLTDTGLTALDAVIVTTATDHSLREGAN